MTNDVTKFFEDLSASKDRSRTRETRVEAVRIDSDGRLGWRDALDKLLVTDSNAIPPIRLVRGSVLAQLGRFPRSDERDFIVVLDEDHLQNILAVIADERNGVDGLNGSFNERTQNVLRHERAWPSAV